MTILTDPSLVISIVALLVAFGSLLVARQALAFNREVKSVELRTMVLSEILDAKVASAEILRRVTDELEAAYAAGDVPKIRSKTDLKNDAHELVSAVEELRACVEETPTGKALEVFTKAHMRIKERRIQIQGFERRVGLRLPQHSSPASSDITG